MKRTNFAIIQKQKLNVILIGLIISGMLFSCAKMDHYYASYAKKAHEYAGRLDTVLVRPGHNRIQLSWEFTDPNLEQVMIYWNDKTDSAIVKVEANIFNGSKIIQNLPEQTYSFEIFTKDKSGNFSIPVAGLGRSYGELYLSSLYNRVYRDIKNQDDGPEIEWVPESSPLIVGTEIRYSTSDGEKLVVLPMGVNYSKLNGYLYDTEMEFRTMHIPELNAIDTFYSLPGKIVIESP